MSSIGNMPDIIWREDVAHLSHSKERGQMTDTLDTLTAAAVVERQKLQRHFGRFDILFFLICTIVGVDTIATVARGGVQAFAWMMIFAVAFFVPQALLFSELGAAFPQEGGPYHWTRLAFGHLAGAVNNLLYWITNPVWIGASIRRDLTDLGVRFDTDNDSEVAARFVARQMASGGADLAEALRRVLKVFDGFFTLLVASSSSLAVVRDSFACKPMVVAQTDDYVAVASEYVALADLPGIEKAAVFEPAPEEIYTWSA